MSNKVKSGISFKITNQQPERERVGYAFIVDGEVKYIGVCESSTTTLKDRMSRYKNWQGGGTNKRIAKKIKGCLENKRVVKIFALNPRSPCKYNDLDVDLVKGLENPLIEKLEPKWNRR